jgi:hypothetical protein
MSEIEQRVIRFKCGPHEFAFRIPTRGDIAAARRKLAMKLTVTGLPAESDQLDMRDGNHLWWDAQLEVGLVPALLPDGTKVNHGETAPDHWFVSLKNLDGTEVRALSFASVPEAEFLAVANHVDEILQKKKAELARLAKENCSPYAIVPISA